MFDVPETKTKEETRTEVIKLTIYGVIAIILLISALFFIANVRETEREKEEYREQCENNPRLLYAEKCKNKEQCVKACVQRLRE